MKRDSRKQVRDTAFAGIVVAVSLLIFFTVNLIVVDHALLDSLPYARGELEVPDDVVIVAIDEYSFDRFERTWPWPRDWLAEVFRKLDAAGVAAVGLDVSLVDPSDSLEADAELARAVNEVENVVLATKLVTQRGSRTSLVTLEQPLSEFAQDAVLGHVNLRVSPDGRVRLTPRRYSQARSFSSRLASVLEPARDPAGDTMFRYSGRPGEFPRVSFYDVHEGNVPSELLQGAIVIIGAWYPESNDRFLVVGSTDTPMYGAEVHANLVQAYRSDELVPLASSAAALPLLLVALAGVLSSLFARRTTSCYLILGSSAVVSLAAAPLLFLLIGTYLPVGRLLPAVTAAVILALGYRVVGDYRLSTRVRSTFQRFVAPEVVNLLVQSETEEWRGETREVAILFSDVRSFTTMSEGLSPQAVVDLLNLYFDPMIEMIHKHKGTFDKFIGDAIMAIFGAPNELENPSESAVQSAMDMLRALPEVNGRLSSAGLPPVSIGIGIHYGFAVVGLVGTGKQQQFTAIGDVVNVASRLESLCKQVGSPLVVSNAVAERVNGAGVPPLVSAGPIKLKGKTSETDIYIPKLDSSERGAFDPHGHYRPGGGGG